jgi:hypothetical protein
MSDYPAAANEWWADVDEARERGAISYSDGTRTIVWLAPPGPPVSPVAERGGESRVDRRAELLSRMTGLQPRKAPL